MTENIEEVTFQVDERHDAVSQKSLGRGEILWNGSNQEDYNFVDNYFVNLLHNSYDFNYEKLIVELTQGLHEESDIIFKAKILSISFQLTNYTLIHALGKFR